jgi:bacterioferritin-associated ferredoxin
VYVCHCRAVTDREVRAAIDAGAKSIHALAEATGAGGRCRGCWPSLLELLAESGDDRDGDRPRVPMLRA